ncbi:cobyrinate a,c-diamide synthase [Granulicoccus sp. GXG6511]|uniref:cobyrinate a,c-diamide synthase n=1 Tax=Granulicoccus sp. GXG6511 TaxID=3381351 RepID=UPI003D7CCAA2
MRLPRLVIGAPASGHGKTTVASGLMAALRARGHEVAPGKVGPDYIDPGYHSLATGRPGRNLDPVLCGEERIVPLLLHGAQGADLAVIEGVMGLFDGQFGTDGFGSTAHVARLTSSPVVLVVDISHTSQTVAAWVHGLATFDPRLRVAGVILNKAGSPRHASEAVRSLEATGVEVLGVLHRDSGIVAPSRHLGLVPVAERAEAAGELDRLATQLAAEVDLDALHAIAQSAPDLAAAAWDPLTEVTRVAGEPTIAVAGGRSFTFRYPENVELLTAAGCRVVEFDPLTDARLPADTAGIVVGGGFPEVYAESLAQNVSLTADIAARVRSGVPTIAECAGLLYLARSLDGHPMADVVAARAAMDPKLVLGYRTGIAPIDSVVAVAGTRVKGHEFHRTRLSPAAGAAPAWLLDGRADGFASASLHASYLHVHWAGFPDIASRFAAAAAACREHPRQESAQ